MEANASFFGYAHRYQEWVDTALLLAVAAAACVLLVWALALWSQRAARILGIVLCSAYLGLLPITVVIAAVVASLLRGTPPEYVAATPWLLIFAVPICIVTLPIAIFIALRSARDRPRRVAPSTLAFVLAVAAAAPAVFLLVHQRQQRLSYETEAEQLEVYEFVKDHAAVTAAIGTDNWAPIPLPESERSGASERYFVEVFGAMPNHFVVVDVERAASAVDFRIACIVPRASYRSARQARRDPCEADGALAAN